MESGFVAVGAAAVAYYVYSRTRRDLPAGVVETHRHVEQAPRNWTGELYLFAEALRYLYLEYITHWQTADLFIGVLYLARQGIRDFPAAEVVAHGTRIQPRSLGLTHIQELKNKFEIMYRLLLYSQKLRNTSVEIPTEEWMDLELTAEDFVVYRPRASVLCPAYVIVKDHKLRAFVLAIRGTHTTRDIFTSLSGAAKPHHYLGSSGLVLGYSHFGMLAGARWIYKHCKQALLAAHEAHPDYKLLITGHSMGGGAAALLTMMYREQVHQFPQFGDAECYTFACPGCMTLELAQSCSPYVTSLIYGTDVVPTISPAAGDLLREEVSKSSWGASFKQDIRSSVLVQSIETRMQGMYRSASTWTLRQARAVSSLTTRCVRPKDVPMSPSMGQLRLEEELTAPLTESVESVPATEEFDRHVQDPIEMNALHEKPTTTTRSSSGWRMGSWSDLYSKMASLTLRRRVADAESSTDRPESAENREEDVEGVFNTQGIEDDGKEDMGEASTSSTGPSNQKRLLYPAGHLYHLVPEYILKAASPTREDPENEESEDTSSDTETWSQLSVYDFDVTGRDCRYHPREHVCVGEGESAFVLFSDMPQEAYGKIRVCRSMVMDHFVPRYKVALKSTIQEFNAVLEDTTTQTI